MVPNYQQDIFQGLQECHNISQNFTMYISLPSSTLYSQNMVTSGSRQFMFNGQPGLGKLLYLFFPSSLYNSLCIQDAYLETVSLWCVLFSFISAVFCQITSEPCFSLPFQCSGRVPSYYTHHYPLLGRMLSFQKLWFERHFWHWPALTLETPVLSPYIQSPISSVALPMMEHIM